MRQRAAFSQGGLPFRRACLSIQCNLPNRSVEVANIATTQHRPPYSKAPDRAGHVAAGPCRVARHLGSYLNSIKADQRAPTASLLFKLAGALPGRSGAALGPGGVEARDRVARGVRRPVLGRDSIQPDQVVALSALAPYAGRGQWHARLRSLPARLRRADRLRPDPDEWLNAHRAGIAPQPKALRLGLGAAGARTGNIALCSRSCPRNLVITACPVSAVTLLANERRQQAVYLADPRGQLAGRAWVPARRRLIRSWPTADRPPRRAPNAQLPRRMSV